MHLNKNNIIYNSLILSITLLILFCISYLSRNCSFYGDDLGYTAYTDLKGCIKINSGVDAFSKHSGGYLCLILTRFFNFDLPNILNVHPADFMSFPSNVIKSIFYAIISFLTVKISKNFVDSKPLFTSLYFLTFSYFTYSIMVSDAYIFTVTHSFYRYIFPLLFYCIFINFLYKSLLGIEQNKVKKIIFLIPICFFLGTSVELIFFSLVAFIFLLLIYNGIIFIINKSSAKNLEFYNFNIKNIIVIGAFLVSTTSFVFSEGFKTVSSDRGLEEIKLSIATIKEFCYMYFQMDILKIWWLWLIGIIVMVLAFYLCRKNNKPREIFFPIFLQFSNLLVLFSLVLCGKTYDFTDSFWLTQPNVQGLFKILLFIPFLMIYSLVYHFTKEKFQKNILVIISTIFAIIFILLSVEVQIKNYNNGNAYFSEDIRKANYSVEKIYRFFYLSQKKIYLPKSLIQMNKHLLNSFHWSRDFICTDNENCGSYGALNSKYYPLIYKDNKTKTLEYCFNENAIDEFYKAGGCITEEEIKDIKFSRLKDDDFIFKKNKNCISKEYLAKILKI